jgi:hypothetical protein
MSDYAVLEYMYRDGGNWKTRGELLLDGKPAGTKNKLLEFLDWGNHFVAEQVSIPSLCSQHFADCDDGPSDIDHAYHEFVDLRPATDAEVAVMQVTGKLSELVERFSAAAGRWDVTLSPNCWL